MSNDAILINTPAASHNFFEKDKTPSEYVELATGAYRIPIPWFFCFNADDLHTVQYDFGESAGEVVVVTVPITETLKAKENLFAARELMGQICADQEIGEGYWQKALGSFTDFNYNFITLNYSDILHAGPWDDELFNRCFSRTEEAFGAIKELSCYEGTHLPYSADQFYSTPELPDADRVNNSAAMDGGFVDPAYRYVAEAPSMSGSVEKPQVRPWWMFWR